MKKIYSSDQPNPQGKGLVPVLQELTSRKAMIDTGSYDYAHATHSILQDYIISRLILCADFKFKPVVNMPYYLYVKNQTIKLSLISPTEWTDSQFGTYICTCQLKPSSCWHISSQNKSASATSSLAAVISQLKNTLLSDLFTDQSLQSTLPFYDERLDFHQRVLANALASRITQLLSKKLDTSFKQLMRQHIEHSDTLLLLDSSR